LPAKGVKIKIIGLVFLISNILNVDENPLIKFDIPVPSNPEVHPTDKKASSD